MRIALEDLRLDRLVVIYPGERRYALAEQVEVVPLMDLCTKGGNLFERIVKMWCSAAPFFYQLVQT